jgi:hypothetical protein
MISVIVTNAILGIESLLLAWLLKRQQTISPVHYDFIVVLVGIGLSSLLTAMWHAHAGNSLWRAILVLIGIVAGSLSSAAIGILWPKYHRMALILFSFVTIIYFGIISIFPKYSIAICYYGLAALLLFYALTVAYHLTKHPQIRYGIIAMVLLLIASLCQQSLISVESVPGNLLYNLIMIPGIYLCYLAVAAVILKHATHGFKEVYVNDLHSRMNETVVNHVIYPQEIKLMQETVIGAKEHKQIISICGSRHAMGGQQFAENSVLIDMSLANRVNQFDKEKGHLQVESGVAWPKLIRYLQEQQPNTREMWTIAQKQTGADDLTIGGALSANIHGRGLLMKPFVQDIVAFDLINAQGDLVHVSRQENAELFSLAIGGYGLFGLIQQVQLQLVKRQALQRKVALISTGSLAVQFEERISQGFLYGDFQFMTDEKSTDFLQTGVFSCYQPTQGIPESENQFLSQDDWNKLLLLAHVNKAEAFKRYSEYYLSTDGQCYWSDKHQLGFYNEKYIEYIRSFFPDWRHGSLMITEVYVPLREIANFMTNVANDATLKTMNIIYGTVRLIKKDDETYLPWAKQDYACIIFNLNVPHTNSGFQYAQDYFSRLIDHALAFNGSFYLTYHRYARKDQIEKAYPNFKSFLELKLKYDPEERFQSDWYQFYKRMFMS